MKQSWSSPGKMSNTKLSAWKTHIQVAFQQEIYTHIHTYICTYVTTFNKRKGHDFEWQQRWACWRVWGEEMKGGWCDYNINSKKEENRKIEN